MSADPDTLESVLVDLTGIDLKALRSHPRNVFANSVHRVLDHKNDINQYAGFESVLGDGPLNRDE